MKLTSIILLAGCLHASATGHSQTVSVSFTNAPLETVFKELQKQTGFNFIYTSALLKDAKSVTLNAKNEQLLKILQECFKNQPLTYTIVDKYIVVKPSATSKFQPGVPLSLPPPLDVHGIVTDENDTPLQGISIMVKGTGKGTSTNIRGEFTLNNIDENSILVITSVGYDKQEIPVNNRINISVQLKVAVANLDEMQITGYGETSKRLSTGSIGTVKADEIARQPVLTAFDAIIGRVPGVIVSPISGNAAAPLRVEIRGRNTLNLNAITDPLYVIDGVPLTALNASAITGNLNFSMGAVQAGITNTAGENPLLNIDPQDIESINILKDADATAIYGSRGANGVILITTKKAKTGPTRIDVNISYGFKYLQKFPNLLNTADYLAIRQEAFQNDGILPNISNAPDLTIWEADKYTDWQRLFIGTGNMTNVRVGVSGGVGQTSYRLTAGFASQKEIMNNGGKNERVNFGSTLSHSSLDQKFSLQVRNDLAVTNVEAYAIGSLGSTPPNAPDIYDANGLFNFVPYRNGQSSDFPFAGLKNNSISQTLSLRSTANVRYRITNKLHFSTTAGYNFSRNNNVGYNPAAAIDPLYGAVAKANFGNSTNNGWMVEPQLSYSTTIGRGKLSTQLLGSVQAVETQGVTTLASGFPNDIMMKSINNASIKIPMEGYKEYRYTSGAAIINYTWENKYVVNLNGRRDGSSRFGPGKQLGNFGSLGMAWILSEEEWFKKQIPAWFSFFKLRGSIGVAGNDGIGDYEYLSRWSSGYTATTSTVMYPYNGTNAFHVVRPLNQQFQWESTRKMDIAASFGLLDDNITFEVNYYNNLTNNQLTGIPTALYTGFASVTGNWEASVANKGLEVSAFAQLIDRKDWNISMNFNFSTNRNKLVDFPGLDRSPHADRYVIGQSLTTVYLLRYTGIDPLTGNYTFEDFNKDGRIVSTGGNFTPVSDLTDRRVAIDLFDKFRGGFGLNIKYKQVLLAAQFSYVNKLSQNPFLTSIPGGMYNMVVPDDILENHWRQPGDQAKYPRFTTRSTELGNISQSDASYINGSYVRLANISLNYQLPANWLAKLKMKGASLAINTQNLFTITSFKGYDPDIPLFNTATPTPRTIATSLNINL